jgi:hypothetical protein
MKKIYLLLTVLVFTLSCSKDNDRVCKNCQVWGSGGVNEIRRVCDDKDESPPMQYDSQGNSLNMFCPD